MSVRLPLRGTQRGGAWYDTILLVLRMTANALPVPSGFVPGPAEVAREGSAAAATPRWRRGYRPVGVWAVLSPARIAVQPSRGESPAFHHHIVNSNSY